MTKRLQVLLPDDQYDGLQRVAAASGVTVAAFVRDVLADAVSCQPYEAVETKLACVREAATYSFPTGDVEQMLDEIDRGRDLGLEDGTES